MGDFLPRFYLVLDRSKRGIFQWRKAESGRDGHLTPRGWERGAWKLDGPRDLSIKPPDDRVLTYEYQEEITSPFSGISITNREIWRGESEEAISELRGKHGEPPRELYVPSIDDKSS